jgi:amino acid transporter
VNAVVGAGVLALPAKLAASAGPHGFLVIAAAFALIALIALCTIEVASRFDVTGGPMHYTHATFGPSAGYAVGWLMWVSRLASFGAITTVLLDYAAGLWPQLDGTAARAAAATLIVASLTVVNLRGVSSAARLSNLLAILKVLPLMLLALAGAWFALRHGARAPAGGATNLSEALLIALFACIGFEAGPSLREKCVSPDATWRGAC